MNPLAFVRKTDELKHELDKEIIDDKLDIPSGQKELLSNHYHSLPFSSHFYSSPTFDISWFYMAVRPIKYQHI
ncbi:MAG: hypothetical protein WAZ77_12945 [Candidatus Nitrosopolaris sp.]|jgi:hypothetical protein